MGCTFGVLASQALADVGLRVERPGPHINSIFACFIAKITLIEGLGCFEVQGLGWAGLVFFAVYSFGLWRVWGLFACRR